MTRDSGGAASAILPSQAASIRVMPRVERPAATRTFRAMASDVTLTVIGPKEGAPEALDRAEQVFHDVESACTRFDPTSPLMCANAAPTAWHVVPVECFLAVQEAAHAHQETGGGFDPRVLRSLESFGYTRSLPFANGDVRLPAGLAPIASAAAPGAGGPWRPEFDAANSAIRIGTDPIDLGGIGKGLAVRWAAAELLSAGTSMLIDAGGDLVTRGAGPEEQGWRVGVENPFGGTDPVAVLAVHDAAVATSSVRLRRWQVGGQIVHHIVDPRTGRPGGTGLMSVTVVESDPAEAEVWSKTLFLAGSSAIAERSRAVGKAALWVTDRGDILWNTDMDQHMAWSKADVAG